MRTALAGLLFLTTHAFAQQWEYKVLQVTPIDFRPSAVVELGKGITLFAGESRYLTELAADGWGVISVVGNRSTHVVHLRRVK
jgi:hypothetical protein